jgi:hypothetical protein
VVCRHCRTVHAATPAEPVTTQEDIIAAHAWGLTLTQWWALSDFERAECRRLITTAPRFGVDR